MKVTKYLSKCGIQMEVIWINGEKFHRVQGGTGSLHGYTGIHVAHSADGQPVAQHKVPTQWLLDDTNLSRVYTGGKWYSKLAPQPGESFNPPR